MSLLLLLSSTPPSVEADQSVYGVQSITITWSGVSGDTDTKIAIAPSGSDESVVTDWVYTNGTQVEPLTLTSTGSHTFSAITVAGTYVPRVLSSGVVPITWTVDPTSDIGVPVDAIEWADVMSAAGIGSGGPAHLWELQVDPNDSIGGEPVTGTISSSFGITGWTRQSVGFIDASGDAFYNTTVGDTFAGSQMLLAYVRIDTVTGTRDVMGLGSGADYRGVQITPTLHFQAFENSGSSTATGAGTVDGNVHPVLLQVNTTAGTFKIYTDIEVITGTFVAPVGAGALTIFGAAVMQTATEWYLYIAEWAGVSAEISQSQAKSLLQTLGWTIPWS